MSTRPAVVHVPYASVKRTNSTIFAVNPTYGIDMNQSPNLGGTPDGIHNGTDSALWTGTNIAGASFDFASTAQAKAGTHSIDAASTVKNDKGLLTRSSAISTGSYVAMTGWVYITGWVTTGTKDIGLTLRNAGTDVGSEVTIGQYINTGLFNGWQKFTIAMTEFTATTANFNEIVIRTVSDGAGDPPNYYLDSLQWEQTGDGPITYTIAPPEGRKLYVYNLHTTISGSFNTTLVNASHQALSPDKFFNLTALDSGILFRTYKDGQLLFTYPFTRNLDFLSFPGVRLQSGGDGSKAWMTVWFEFPAPFSLDARTNDRIEFIVTDDISSLDTFRFSTVAEREEASSA